MKDIHLLIIDPQNDFCDLPGAYCAPDPGSNTLQQPALPVPGAHADMQRLAHLIATGGTGLAHITLTLDSHHHLDIAHPTFWESADTEGGIVPPFTQISAADVRAGRYHPRQPEARTRALQYLDALEKQGRYQHMVWPVHCETGSWGHAVHPDLRRAYNRWERQTLKTVHKVFKGSNPWTEHYSAIRAEIPDPEDAATHNNQALLAALERADLVLIAGEAGSHCVRATTEHIVEYLPAPAAARLALLTDCISPVAGFENEYSSFLQRMSARGVRITDSVSILPELRHNAAS